eukprot:scaffold163559_cov34-Prasinocladus_malaysianus.AAC.2
MCLRAELRLNINISHLDQSFRRVLSLHKQEEGIVVKSLDSKWGPKDTSGSWLKVQYGHSLM